MAQDDLPSPDLPTPRFVAPFQEPRRASTRMHDVVEGPPRLDRAMVLGLIAFHEYSVERSLLEGVGIVASRDMLRRLPDGTLRRERATGPPSSRATVDEVARGLRDALEDAVARAIEGRSRAAVFLSGGLDSSAVAAAASAVWRRRDLPPRDLRFVHFLPESGPSEAAHAQSVARHLGHSFVAWAPDGRDVFEGNDGYYRENDLPSDDGGLARILVPMSRLAEEGVEIVLTGDGGDEAVTDEYVRPWRRATALRTLRSWVAHHVRRKAPVTLNARARAFDAPAWVVSRLEGLPLPVPAPPPRRGLDGAAGRRDQSIRTSRQMVITSCTRAAARTFGLEAAAPFLDARVADFVVSAPQGHFERGRSEGGEDRRDKSILRAAFVGRLPETVLGRTKADQPFLEEPFREHMRQFGPSWIDRFVADGPLERLDVAPLDHVAGLLREAVAGSDAAMSRFLAITSIGAWARARSL